MAQTIVSEGSNGEAPSSSNSLSELMTTSSYSSWVCAALFLSAVLLSPSSSSSSLGLRLQALVVCLLYPPSLGVPTYSVTSTGTASSFPAVTLQVRGVNVAPAAKGAAVQQPPQPQQLQQQQPDDLVVAASSTQAEVASNGICAGAGRVAAPQQK